MTKAEIGLDEFYENKRTATKEGTKKVSFMRLSGYDNDEDVEWKLTLKHEGEEMPNAYTRTIGKKVGTVGKTCLASIITNSEQTKLS